MRAILNELGIGARCDLRLLNTHQGHICLRLHLVHAALVLLVMTLDSTLA